MIDKTDAEQIALAIKACREKHTRRYVKRTVVVCVTIGILWIAGDIARAEVLTRGWEFLVPALVDKFIFGIGE